MKILAYVTSILVDNNTMASGNSGGPWINTKGELVAVGSWGFDDFDFDILGVSSKSLLMLIDKYIENNGTAPWRYMGKVIEARSGKSSLEPLNLRNIYASFPWHKTFTGCLLNRSTINNIAGNSIISEIYSDNQYKIIGQLNTQYRLFELDIVELPLRDKTLAEDGAFASYRKNIFK